MAELTRKPLKQGYLLEGYRIEKLLGGGGFSLVYLAFNVETRAKMVVKEYFPSDLVDRLPGGRVLPLGEIKLKPFQMGIRRFFEEASALAKLQHPNIVHVSNFFRQNGTAYMVMDYEVGRDLRWFIKRSKGRVGVDFMWAVFPQISMGLRELHHNNFLHLDIKPANILLRAGGRPLLLDFGAVQRVTKEGRFRGVQTLTHGFAAPEQYQQGSMGAWSDMYALGATMYGCITGTPPPHALERIDKDRIIPITKAYARRYPRSMLTAIEWAMQLDHNYRPQNIDAFLKLTLDGAPERIAETWMRKLAS